MNAEHYDEDFELPVTELDDIIELIEDDETIHTVGESE